MAQKKITQLPAATGVNFTDLLAKVNDPSGTPVTQKATVAQLSTALNGTGVYASRPSAGNSGYVYYPTDGVSIDRDNGSAFAPFGPLNQLTPVVNGNFSWVNQGSSTVTAAKGTVYFEGQLGATGHALRMRTVAVPAGAYTATVGLFGIHVIQADFFYYGMVLYDGTAAQTIYLNSVANAAPAKAIGVANWTNVNAFNASLAFEPTYTSWNVLWFRITDDTANKSFSFSYDGINFRTLTTIAHNSFLTATQIGFFTNTYNATYQAAMTVISWSIV